MTIFFRLFKKNWSVTENKPSFGTPVASCFSHKVDFVLTYFLYFDDPMGDSTRGS